MDSTTEEVAQMNTSSLKITRLACAVVAVALAAATAVSVAEASRPLVPQRAAIPTLARGTALPGTLLRTLTDAVSAGKVDGRLVAQLRAHGSADAIISFDQAAIVARAERAASRSARPASRLLTLVRPAFGAEERRVLSDIRELRVVDSLDNLPLSHVRIDSPAALLALANAPGVVSVSANRRYRMQLKQSLPLIRQPQAAAAGKTGAGTYVAVLDSGVDYRRSAFGSCTAPGTPATTCRVAMAWDQAPDDGLLDSVRLHGTNVAGIVAGVAPAAKVIGVDVFRPDGAYDSDVQAAINKVVGLKRSGINVRAINLSLGDVSYHKGLCPRDSYAASFALARSVGILPVVAAGNDGTVAKRFHRGVGSPACAPGAVSVGAVYDARQGRMDWRDCVDRTRADKIVCWSQAGRTLTLLAPGSSITAAEVTMSGTSQATPHVAGAVAVLAAQNPAATPDRIEAVLKTTGKLIRDRRAKRSFRRLDLVSALAAIGSTPPQPPVDRTPPTVTAPDQTIPVSGWSLGSAGATPLTLSWRGSDASGIAQFRVQASVNGGAFADVALPSATATSVTLNNLQPGSSYRFAVAAKDRAGNWSGWAYGPSFTVGLYQEGAASYSASWELLSWSEDLGGYQASTSAAGAYLTFDFTGRQVAWIAPSSPLNGQAYAWLDGRYLGYVDEYSTSTIARKVQLSVPMTYGTHRLTLQAVGTQGRPQIDVDAFVVLR
jgi:subtilisin family serine protease